MNHAAVSAELAAKFSALTGVRVYAFPPDAVQTPALIIGYPDSIDYDTTFARGVDRMIIPIFLLVDRNWDRNTTEHISDFTAGSGASSVKQLVQTQPHTAFSTARVRTVTLDTISVAGIEMWAATFLVDITGPGS